LAFGVFDGGVFAGARLVELAERVAREANEAAALWIAKR
jgi:hypothetical protein